MTANRASRTFRLVQKITLSYIVLRLECVCANASYCQLLSDAVTWVQVSEAVQSQALNVETHLELDRDRLDECFCEQPAVLLSCHSTSTNIRCYISGFIRISDLTIPAEDCSLVPFTVGLPKLEAVFYPDLRPWILPEEILTRTAISISHLALILSCLHLSGSSHLHLYPWQRLSPFTCHL